MIELERSVIDGLTIIGQGASGKVYQYEDDKIIKLFHAKWSKEKVWNSFVISKTVAESGVQTAAMYDFVKCENQYGYLAERLKGVPLLHYMGTDVSKRLEAAKRMGQILKQVHSIKADESVFPPLREMFGGIIDILAKYFTKEQQVDFITFIDTLPGKPCVLHGDFHENNIMMADGKYNLIDLDSMCIGSPMFDLIQSYCSYRAELPEELKKMINRSDETLQEFLFLMLENYFGIKDRTVLKRYDDLFTKASAFMRFFAPLFMGLDTEENLRKHVSDNIDSVHALMAEMKEELPKIAW